MQAISEMINNLRITTNGMVQSYSPKDYEQRRVDQYNKTKGGLEGYDCPECNNRGNFARLYEDTQKFMGNRKKRFKQCNEKADI